MPFKFSAISLALISSMAFFQVSYAQMIGADKGDVSVDNGDIDATSSNLGVYSTKGHKLEVIDDNIYIRTRFQGAKASNENSRVIVGTKDTEKTIIEASSTRFTFLDFASVVAENKGVSVVDGKSIELRAISSSTRAAYGVYAEGGNAEIGSDVTEKIIINNQGNSKPDGTNSESSGIMAYTAGSTVTVNTKELEIDSSGVGLFVQSNTDEAVAPEGSASIQINADLTTITASDTGIRAFSNGQVGIAGGVTINAPLALDVRGNSTTNINTSHSGVVQINGDIAFETPGAEQNSGSKINANVNIYMSGSDSYWTGNAYKDYTSDITGNEDNTKVTGFQLTLADGAVWTPTLVEESDGEKIIEKQAINNLTFNGGVVNVVEDGDQDVKIENTSGSGGTVKLHTSVGNDGTMTASSIDFGTVENGGMKLDVEYTGITADDIKNGTLSGIEGGVQNEGIVQTKKVGQGAVKGEITESYDKDGNLISQTQAKNTRLTAYGSVAALGVLQWRHDMNDLTKRMGELRTSPEGVGSWVRLYGSEQEYGGQGITSKNTSIQVGADFDVGAGWKVGAAFTYTDGSSSYDLGDADNKAYGFAIYGTWFAENGQFVDLIAKYSRLDTDFNLEGMDGSFDNNAYSFSAEYGWHLKLGDLAFVEPQVELTYGMISGDDFETGNDVRIEQDDFDSFIGRVGLRAGFVFPENKGTIYARASVLHDFQGELDSKASLISDSSVAERVNDDLGGTWYEFGVGANFNLTDRTYTYVDLEKNTGGEVKENWRWNIGLRHVF